MKEENNPVSFFDLFRKAAEKANQDLYDTRIEVCSSCDLLIKPTFQCKECGCFMKLKAKLVDATCPLGKWQA